MRNIIKHLVEFEKPISSGVKLPLIETLIEIEKVTPNKEIEGLGSIKGEWNGSYCGYRTFKKKGKETKDLLFSDWRNFRDIVKEARKEYYLHPEWKEIEIFLEPYDFWKEKEKYSYQKTKVYSLSEEGEFFL